MWQTLTAVAVPIILGLVGFLGSGGTRLSKRILHHADLLGKLDSAPEASKAMASLLAKEVGWLDAKESARNTRRVNWQRVRMAALVGASSLIASGAGLLVAAEVAQINSSLGHFAFGGTISVTGYGFFVTGVALSRIFEPAQRPPA